MSPANPANHFTVTVDKRRRVHVARTTRALELLISDDTTHRVVEATARRQARWLAGGATKVRLLRRDVARELDLSEATVSRCGTVVLETPRGAVTLAECFDGGGASGRSSSEILARVATAVLADGGRLSDAALVELLARQGIEIARRTIAKYRHDLLGVPCAWRRRKAVAA